MSDEGKNIWSDDDTTERLMNLATLHIPLTGEEMGCALVLFALPLASALAVLSVIA